MNTIGLRFFILLVFLVFITCLQAQLPQVKAPAFTRPEPISPASTTAPTNFPERPKNTIPTPGTVTKNRQLMPANSINSARSAHKTPEVHYELPPATADAKPYFFVYEQLSGMADHAETFSVREATFLVENAFLNGHEDYFEFTRTILETGKILQQKMLEFGYDTSSNMAKNLILLRFFF